LNFRIDPEVYASLDPEKKAYVDRELAAYEALVERNPLQAFRPHSVPQRDFIFARTPIVAAFAGNQFGKSTVLTVCALREACDREILPSWLRETKRYDAPTHGWILCPTEDKIYDSFQLAFEEWAPRDALLGGSWGKAFNGQRLMLRFKNGSTISFKTYKQHESTLGGARLHWVGYDEPPPQRHREECMMRLVRYGGFEMFAMTPLKTHTGYVRREIYRKRESPDITVVRGSIHDNPTLTKATVDRVLGSHTDLWRRAREFGDFVEVGGLIYPDFERCVLEKPLTPAGLRDRGVTDVVVGIDPGIRNAGVVWVGFDSEDVAFVFDELLLQDKTPRDYANAIRARNREWGLRDADCWFVCDPAARQRGQTNAETVLSALAKERIYANTGQNDVEAGIGQARTRMQHKRLWVSPSCRGLRDEADDYAAREPDEGKDDSHLEPIKGGDHRLDALRYALMERFWDPAGEDEAPNRNLGWSQTDDGQEVAGDPFTSGRTREAPPLGAMM